MRHVQRCGQVWAGIQGQVSRTERKCGARTARELAVAQSQRNSQLQREALVDLENEDVDAP